MFANLATPLRIAALVALAGVPALAGDDGDPARVRRAVAYLDDRQEQWSKFAKSQRGEGADKTSCVSCHTGVGYAIARPALRPFAAETGIAPPERRMVATARFRDEHWAELDSPRFELMYTHEDAKKVESRGTEAVLNALILARDDASSGRTEPAPAARSAFEHLWATQAKDGADAGSWDWLNFGLGPWETNGSRAYGACLAALAVGSSSKAPDDEASARGVTSLRAYLRRKFPEETLFNRLWIVEASRTLEGVLSSEQRREVVDQLLAVRRDDGGWSLADLGPYKRVDGSAQVRQSDGYATGLVLHVLLRVDLPPTKPEVAKGLEWLRTHQQGDGSWAGRSVNKERDPSTFIGKLMTDAATAMAALALVEAGPR